MANQPEIESCGLTQIGPVREENQDSILLSPEEPRQEKGWLFAVADGIGGYSHGQIASSLAVEKLLDTVYGDHVRPGLTALRQGIEVANLSIFQTAQKLNVGHMGTTLTAACILGQDLHLVHVGDSRAYLIRGGKASCLTNDHTMVGELVRMRVLGPEKVRSHAQRSILTRGVGLSLFVKPDQVRLQLEPGDRLILCSDGVWSVIEDEEIASLSEKYESTCEFCQILIDMALERESDDNVSAVAVTIQAMKHSNQTSMRPQNFFDRFNPARYIRERSNHKQQEWRATPGV